MNETFKEYKECTRCHEIKYYTEFYKSTKGFYTWCKSCHKKKIVSYKSIPLTYAFLYRRMGQLKRYALKNNIDFSLKVSDYEDLKNEIKCHYCNLDVDLVAITRKDKNIGYTKENTVIVCDLCHRLHSRYNFNDSESKRMGKVIASYYRRVRKGKEIPDRYKPVKTKYMEDKSLVLEILKD